MKIALAQMDVIPNRPDKNVEKMLSMIDEAKKQKVDLIAFPEMCIGGYFVGDKWLSDDFCLGLMEYNEIIREASNGIAIAFGNVFLDRDINERVGDENYHPGRDGRIRRYNAVHIVQNGEYAKRVKETRILPTGAQPKTLLPNYRIFDDVRYFFSLEDIAKDFGVPLSDITQPFLIKVDGKEVPVGFELCEDLWCNDYRKGGKAINPTKALIENGAELIVNISASPWTFGKNNARDRRVLFLKNEINERFVPFAYVNCVGAQNNGKNIITFDGGSTVYNSNGKAILLAEEAYEEELLIIDNFDMPEMQRKEKPMIEQKYNALVRGVRHMRDIFGIKKHPKFVIGLSGGIDSSVTAALLSIAVGKDNVIAVNMPTKYNSEKTKNAARHVADELGIKYLDVPIEELVGLNSKLIEERAGKKLSSFNMENLQAKIRGTSILSNIAAMEGAIFTNNGNKLEIALGYATLYGDVGGAIAPIGDLTKREVFELAKFLNKEIFKKEVIPKALIPDELFRFADDQIQPSAELKDAQVDPMKFGYHCAIIEKFTDYMKKSPEDIMRWYLDGTLEENLGITTDLIKRWGIDNPKEFLDDLEWLVSSIEKNVFKRVQAPPIIMTSKSAYGYDIRESQLPFRKSKEWERLKARILKMEKYKKGS